MFKKKKKKKSPEACFYIFFKQWSEKSIIGRSNHQEVLLGKGVLKICSKFTEEHPCRSAISIKLFWNFIEIARRHGFSPVNLLLHILRTLFLRSTSSWLLLQRTRGTYISSDYTNVMKSLKVTVKSKQRTNRK